MTLINRRKFLDRSKKTGLGLAAGMTILADARSARAAPANEKNSTFTRVTSRSWMSALNAESACR